MTDTIDDVAAESVEQGPASPAIDDTEFDFGGDLTVAALSGGEDRPTEFLTDVKLRRLV